MDKNVDATVIAAGLKRSMPPVPDPGGEVSSSARAIRTLSGKRTADERLATTPSKFWYMNDMDLQPDGSEEKSVGHMD